MSTESPSFRTCIVDSQRTVGMRRSRFLNTNTLRTIKQISVPKDPDFTFYDPQSKRVLVCHGDAAVVTAIDPEKAAVTGQIELGGGAEAAQATWGGPLSLRQTRRIWNCEFE